MRAWRFFIPGPLPSLNDMIAAAKGSGGRGMAYAKMKAKWTGDITMLVLAAQIPRGELKRVRCAFEWVGDGRRDPDNVEAGQKFCWDSLARPRKGKPGAGVIPDDNIKGNAGSSHTHRPALPGERQGVWVTVHEVA